MKKSELKKLIKETIIEERFSKVSPSARTWTSVLYAYGKFEILGSYRTKKAAVEAVSMYFDLDIAASIKSKAGNVEIDGRHLVVRTKMLPDYGYPA